MWNDEIDCATTVRDHGRFVIRYARVLRGSGQAAWLFDLGAYDQVATFPSGDDLVIESGFECTQGRGDGERAPFSVAVFGDIAPRAAPAV